MISGVGSYSSYSYASSSTPARPQGCGASGQNKPQEKLFSLLDANSDGSVAKDELATALESSKENDSSLEIDLDELFSQLDANSDGAIDLDETAVLAPPPPPPGQGPEGVQFGQSEGATGNGEDQGYGRLVTALLKLYEAGSGNSASRVGSQLSLSA